jgi:hypothetical protein
MRHIALSMLVSSLMLIVAGSPVLATEPTAPAADAPRPETIVRQEDAFRLSPQELPAGWVVLRAGDLGAIFNRQPDGFDLLSLFDRGKHRQLLSEHKLPLFTIQLRNLETKQDVMLSADGGWKQTAAELDGDKRAEFRWQTPADQRLGELRVRARAELDPAAGAIYWTFTVDEVDKAWSVRRVALMLALDASSPRTTSFFPLGPGQIKEGSWSGCMGGVYPSAGATMQFMAAYDPPAGSGMYVAAHDPAASFKDIRVEGRADRHDVALVFDAHAENSNLGGNGYATSGRHVWRLLRGDWFDAACIYRDWARREALWFPKLGPEGREDTPAWMRELPVWLHIDGDAVHVVPRVEKFARTIGLPVGIHWYNWHQIPFDNDYPHYFPVKEGFAEAVGRLQSQNIYVMPYINGRLWDSRDRGLEDFEFSRLALPAAAKDEDGKPHLESYASKESDGSPVRLAVMCPATELWRATLRRTVLRLMNEYGVKGVYIDQIAAAAPALCFDRGHGHPVGGGNWWAPAYLELLDAIRREKPAQAMLTTESAAEPYVKGIDGYLTWDWCHDGQVPAFPAVYGGALQMFGRAYRGGETADLAFRMKAAQQLVFGEQIGWFEAEMIDDPQKLDFLRQVLGARWLLRRYFHAGQMARPPKLEGDVPSVKADWQWDNPGLVTTDAVLTGAWSIPQQRRAVVLLVNVDDRPITATLHFDTAACGVEGQQVRATAVWPEGRGESFLSPPRVCRELTLPPRSATAWEITPK